MQRMTGARGPDRFAVRLATIRANRHVGFAALDETCASQAETLASDLAKRGIPWPFLYPTEDGGMELEWDAGPWAVSLEIEPGGNVVIDATHCRGGDSHDAETTVDGAVEALVAVLGQAGITWGDE